MIISERKKQNFVNIFKQIVTVSIGSNHNDGPKAISKSNSAKEEKTNIAENSNEEVLEQENCIATEKTESNEAVSNKIKVQYSYTRNRSKA